MSLRRYIAAVVLFVMGFIAESQAQQLVNFPHNRDGNLRLESLLNGSEEGYHTSFKPLLRSRVTSKEFQNFDVVKFSN